MIDITKYYKLEKENKELKKEIKKIDEVFDLPKYLNDTVEILEEEKKIPEKLDDDEYEYNTANEILFMRKINEIIDYLKSKGDE